MKFSHYSAQPVLQVRSVDEEEHNPWFKNDNGSKPAGFWVSVDGPDDWPEWCKSEDFCLHKLAFRHEVKLDLTNILHISTGEELIQFNAQYRDDGGDYSSKIRWRDVARKYKGIIIAPYQWESRLAEGLFWYYTWDCASGCIWDASAVLSIEVVERVDA